ncbi:MAG: hypothetical protein M3209_01710 [Acidobacteriota bacterium]|nr:hypothetical protein [Acidobacteriota bacterium]
MKTIFILTVLIVLSGCSIAFKTNSSAESDQSAKKPEEGEAQSSAIARKSGEAEIELGQTNLTGTYRYKSGRSNNAIGVEDLGGNRLRVSVAANYEYKDSSGEWMANSGGTGGVVTLRNGTAVLIPEGYPDCPITMKFSGNKIEVTHKGAGADCGFGGNVTASGTYTKTSNQLNNEEMADDVSETPTKNSPTGGERVRFAPGKSSTIVSGKISAGDEKTYLVGARAGQTMSLDITEGGANNDVVFYIIAPDGSLPMGSAGESAEYDARWTGKLPKSGDYKVVVGAIESKNVNFRMSVEIR